MEEEEKEKDGEAAGQVKICTYFEAQSCACAPHTACHFPINTARASPFVLTAHPLITRRASTLTFGRTVLRYSVFRSSVQQANWYNNSNCTQ